MIQAVIDTVDILAQWTFWYSRHFSTVDMGVDILGIDILQPCVDIILML